MELALPRFCIVLLYFRCIVRTLAQSMAWAVLIIVASVLGGTLLAFLPQGSRAFLGPVRTFAFAAALGVVLMHMLPEAMEELGFWALVALPLGLLAPEALGKVGAWAWQRAKPGSVAPQHLALEASYVGLLLHRVGDGIGLGIYTGELSNDQAAGGVMAALSAHAVPVVAIVVLTFDSVHGRGSAVKRAVGLAGASLVGVFLTSTVLADSVGHASSFVAAFVSGMLIHVVSHDLSSDLPETFGQKALDGLLAIAGALVSLVGWGLHGPEHGTESEASPLSGALFELGQGFVAPLLLAWVLLALVVGALSPALRTRRKVLQRSLGLAPETLAVSMLTLGASLSLLWWVPRALLGAGRGESEAASRNAGRLSAPPTPLESLFHRAAAELPYLLLVLPLAANIQVGLSGARLTALPALAQLGVALLLGFTIHLPASAVLLLGLPLLGKGLAPSALVCLLLLGPTVSFRAWFDGQVEARERKQVLVTAAVALPTALVAEFLWTGAPLQPVSAVSPSLAMGLLVVGAAWALTVIFQRGLRGVFADLAPAHHHGHSEVPEGAVGPRPPPHSPHI